MLAAIVLNESASPAISLGPPAGRARGEIAGGEPGRGVADPPQRLRDPAREQQARRRRRPSPTPAATARIFRSAPMWNITQPDASTATSGTQTETSASPASCSLTVGSGAERVGDDDADREARRRRR